MPLNNKGFHDKIKHILHGTCTLQQTSKKKLHLY